MRYSTEQTGYVKDHLQSWVTIVQHWFTVVNYNLTTTTRWIVDKYMET